MPEGPLNRLPDVPFNEKWEYLKPTIEHQYIDENLKLFEVISAVKAQYGFDAAYVFTFRASQLITSYTAERDWTLTHTFSGKVIISISTRSGNGS